MSQVRKFPSRRERLPTSVLLGFLCGSAGKESTCNAGDLGRSPAEGKGYPLQYSGLNSMDCIVHGVAKSQTQLSDFHFHFKISKFTQSCPTLCDSMDCSRPGFPVHHQLLELTQTHVRRVSDAIQPSHPLSSPSPPAFNLSSIRVFPNEPVLPIRWPKYWSFSISPSNEYSGLISFKTDWFDLPAVQGTLKNLLQHHSSKASILRSFLYGPTLTSIL